MIDINFISNLIQNELNINNKGLKFLIYADETDLPKKPNKTAGGDVTTAVANITTSSIIPVKNLKWLTINVQVMFMVDMTDTGFIEEEQRKQSKKLIDTKEVIDNWVDTINGTTRIVEVAEKKYTTSLAAGYSTNGQKMELGHITDAFPVYLNIGFAFFENGVNTNDVSVVVNNENIYFTKIIGTKVITADNVFNAKTRKTNAVILAGGTGLDLIAPAIQTDFFKQVSLHVWEDSSLNEAIAICYKSPLIEKVFIGVLGACSENGDIGANLGYNISLLPADEKLVKYNDPLWKFEEVIIEEDNQIYNKQTTGGGFIFWGDTTGDYSSTAKLFEHTYKQKGTYTLRIYGGE